jgi:phosphatidylglycerophosphate synthase
MEVNQRMGAQVARLSLDAGRTPSQLSLANAITGLATGVGVVLLGSTGWGAALVGLVGWQLAYSLDCADGQLARALGKASPLGGVIDSVADFLSQTALLLAVLWGAHQSVAGGLDPVVSAGLFGMWIMSPYYAGVMHDTVAQQPVSGWSPRNVFRQLRDYGLHVAVLMAAMAIRPEWMIFDLIFVGSLNLLVLLRTLVIAARAD